MLHTDLKFKKWKKKKCSRERHQTGEVFYESTLWGTKNFKDEKQQLRHVLKIFQKITGKQSW